MSTKISLKFQTKIDLEFLSKGIHVRLIRLLGVAQLKTDKGWSPEEDVIIDTGNPISILPHSIWSQADVHILLPDRTKIFGLSSGENAGLSGKLGEVVLVFKDMKRTSPPIKLKAHLLDDDSAPFIIGYEDVLTQMKLVSDYKAHSAYVEI